MRAVQPWRAEEVSGSGWVEIAQQEGGVDADSGEPNVWGIEVPARLRLIREQDGSIVAVVDLAVVERRIVVTGVQLVGSPSRPIPMAWTEGLGIEGAARAAFLDRASERHESFIETETGWTFGDEVRAPRQDRWARREVDRSLRGRGGRPPAPRAEVEQAAEVYRKHASSGRPVREVQEALGVSSRTAARRIEQARKAGLLPPAVPGKARA